MKALWKVLKLILAVIFLYGIFIVGYALIKAVHYEKNEPVITVKEQVFSADSEIKCSDIAEFENCTSSEIISASWGSGDYTDLAILSDGSSVIVGRRTGLLTVKIRAQGEYEGIEREIQLTIE